MVTTPRKQFVIPGQPGFYHCISRCVRRAHLCGTDKQSGKNFDHRRDWMVERMRVLTTCFALDIYAYAFLDNHYHIVLYIDPDRVTSWTDEQVIRQWAALWNWRRSNKVRALPKKVAPEILKEWRRRLADVSWVMRLLNEPIARIANAEDEVKGHFWESRFKCTPLLDDASLVACMVYVDLNPIKAGVALTVDGSEYTSIQERIRNIAGEDAQCATNSVPVGVDEPLTANEPLQPVASASPESAKVVSLSTLEYVNLVLVAAEDLQRRRTTSPQDALRALGIKLTGWGRAVTDFASLFRTAAGTDSEFLEFMKKTERKRRQDVVARRALFE